MTNAKKDVFCGLVFCLGGHGHHKPSQTFCLLEPVEESNEADLNGLVLRYSVQDLVATTQRVRSPMDRVTLGELQIMAEDELAKHLMLQVFPPTIDLESSVAKVVVSKLLYTDRTLREIVVLGADTTFDPIAVDLSCPASVMLQKLGKAKAVGKKSTAPKPPGGAVDLLAIMDDPAPPKRIRCERPSETSAADAVGDVRGPEQAREDLLESLGLHDETLRAIVGAEGNESILAGVAGGSSEVCCAS